MFLLNVVYIDTPLGPWWAVQVVQDGARCFTCIAYRELALWVFEKYDRRLLCSILESRLEVLKVLLLLNGKLARCVADDRQH
jgi:hypothetical protein